MAGVKVNRKEIERLHEINDLRDRKLITAKEYIILRKELTARSQSRKERVIGWAEVICVLSPILGILYVLVTKQSGKKKFAILALSLILSMWAEAQNLTKLYKANTSTGSTSEQVVRKEN